MKDKLNKIKECLTAMMDILPNPAVVIVTNNKQKKVKKELADVDKETNGVQKES